MQDENSAEGPNTCPENCYSMPKPLHLEVKRYIEDLLNKGWITKLTSHYAPIVAVWKKDVILQLCCDYRSLNSKTQVDHHPLPPIQDVIDSLKVLD